VHATFDKKSVLGEILTFGFFTFEYIVDFFGVSGDLPDDEKHSVEEHNGDDNKEDKYDFTGESLTLPLVNVRIAPL
jgi:hypothetical protein